MRYFSSSFISYYQPVLQNTCLYHTNSKACLKCYSSISSQISSTYLNFTQFYYISHSINNNIFFKKIPIFKYGNTPWLSLIKSPDIPSYLKWPSSLCHFILHSYSPLLSNCQLVSVFDGRDKQTVCRALCFGPHYPYRRKHSSAVIN